MTAARLKEITLKILASRTEDEEMKAASDLADFYQGFITFESMNSTNESALKGGYALSTFNAAVCVDEFLRTSRFIKGVYAALQEIEKRFPNEKARVLYAGCGPYGTLMLPLFPLLDWQRLDLSMLDIHEESLKGLRQILQQLGYENLPLKLVQDNAMTYQLTEPAHLIVTETMFEALKREPQTDITQNLAPQLLQNGILVPQAIHIDLVYSLYGKELRFSREKQEDMVHRQPYEGRQQVGRVFSLTQSGEFFKQSPQNKFTSQVYSMTGDAQTSPDICVFTEVHIFGDQVLHNAQSTITNPCCLRTLGTLFDGPEFFLEYDFDQTPDWKLEQPKRLIREERQKQMVM